MGETIDAVVIGGGPNGPVAANALADAGWSVLLTEANEEVSGAVRSIEAVAPGFADDPAGRGTQALWTDVLPRD